MQSVVPSLSRIIDTTASKGAYRLEISKRGVLDSLTLCHIPRMEPKEGEVEIQHYGCEVFATVGKKEKREFLVNKLGIPEDHIFNSRSLTFADQIMKITHGEGVDVVLNSLMGEGLVRSYHLLRHKGSFL
ncbi:Lovastatin nonaketide synthase [Pelomyxa schiedti]|nr:Lovastatin nonaketide synthase [Pelomyxa schiedti]